MKMRTWILISLASLIQMSAAQAGQFTLAYINTNNCVRAQSEVMLLNSSAVQVSAVCSAYTPGGFRSNDGRYFDYRLYTTVTIAGANYAGEQIQMGDIDTNDCTFAQSEIRLLNGSAVSVDAECSPYSPGGYSSNNGQAYDYRLTTTVTLR